MREKQKCFGYANGNFLKQIFNLNFQHFTLFAFYSPTHGFAYFHLQKAKKHARNPVENGVVQNT